MTLKRTVPIVLLASLGVTGCGSEAPISSVEAVANIRPSVVVIEVEPASGAPRLIAGGGLIWDDDGHVLTGTTVTDSPGRMTVRTIDGRRFAAALVGEDRLSGLALLRVDEGSGLAPLERTESITAHAGQSVMALGVAAGLPVTVRGGRVSAVDRVLPPDRLERFLQVDVAARPSLEGAVVMTPSGAVVGILARPAGWPVIDHDLALAVPLARATEIAEQLRDRGRVTRGWLGATVTDEAGASPVPDIGVAIIEIVAGSPAAEFGLRRGDRLLRVGTAKIEDAERLNAIVARHDPGEVVALALRRDGREITIRVELADVPKSGPEPIADRPDDVAEVSAAYPEPRERADRSAPDRLGLQVAPLSDAQRGSVPLLGGGVRIAEVVDGPALRAGLRVNDLLLQLNGQTVNSVERYAEVVERITPGASVPVLVQRRDAPIFVTLSLDER